MLTKGESEAHRQIKLSLASSFKEKGWTVKNIDGENDQTPVVENNEKVGDGENKRPDVYAKDEGKGRIVRGEAKIGNGDFESEHSITQYKLFSNLYSSNIASWLIVGVPSGSKALMEKILNGCLDDKSRANVAVWEY